MRKTLMVRPGMSVCRCLFTLSGVIWSNRLSSGPLPARAVRVRE